MLLFSAREKNTLKLNLHKLLMSYVFLLYLTPSYHSTPAAFNKTPELLRHAESKVQFSLKPLPGLGSVRVCACRNAWLICGSVFISYLPFCLHLCLCYDEQRMKMNIVTGTSVTCRLPQDLPRLVDAVKNKHVWPFGFLYFKAGTDSWNIKTFP